MSRANLVDGTKIVKGERRGKKKMKFSAFDRAKPDLILSEGGEMLRLYVV